MSDNPGVRALTGAGWLLAVWVAGCTVDGVDVEGKACPCASGYVCDVTSNRCVVPGGDAGPGGTSSGGGVSGSGGSGGATGGTGGAGGATGGAGGSGGATGGTGGAGGATGGTGGAGGATGGTGGAGGATGGAGGSGGATGGTGGAGGATGGAGGSGGAPSCGCVNPASCKEVGRFATWCGKVNVQKVPGTDWKTDPACSSGCTVGELTYCKSFAPTTVHVTETDPKGTKLFHNAGCAESYPFNGENEFICWACD
ncbi:MAG: hypothetical protein IPI67_15095 [Myxococcales bacterium]|nr:hypothetical protein [Myxococcales bacterium]